MQYYLKLIANKSQKDDYKEQCDYNDTSQSVKGFLDKYLDLFISDGFCKFIECLWLMRCQANTLD